MRSKLNKLILVFVDIILINLAYLLALYIKFEGVVDTQLIFHLPRYLENAIYITIIKLGIFYYFKMYRTVWRYTSMAELYNIITAIILSNASVLSFLFIRQANLSRTIYILTTLIDLSLIGGFRFILRDFHRNIETDIKKKNRMKRVMIIVSGDTGGMFIREYRKYLQLNLELVAIIDDDIKKQGDAIEEIPVVGGRQSIISAAYNYHVDEIIIAIPSTTNREIRELIDICKETECKLKLLPLKSESIEENLSIGELREIEIVEAMRREELTINLSEVSSYITDKIVMVTVGEAGIALEICRQIGELRPKKLTVLGNTANEIGHELRTIYPDLKLKLLNTYIIDRPRIEEILNLEKSEVVFYGGIHKDTSNMEPDPKETINKYIFDTLDLVQAAKLYNVDKFVMISTDKIVSPRNIVDASKIICEMIIQSINKSSNTEYMIVKVDSVSNPSDNIAPFPIEYRLLLKSLEELKRLINEGVEEDIINYIKHIVPSYNESNLMERESENKYA